MTDEIECSGGSDINLDGTASCSECKRPTLVCVKARSKPEVPLDPADYVANFKLGPRPLPQNATGGPGVFLPWQLCDCGIMCPAAPCYVCAHPVELDAVEQARVDNVARQLQGGGVEGNWQPPRSPPVREMQGGRTLIAITCVLLVVGGVVASVITSNPRTVDTVQLD